MVKNEKGFTLVEMLIVLLIISVLIIVSIPNISKHFTSIDEKGCKAFVAMVQGQVEAYKIDHMSFPTINQLVEKGYLLEGKTDCPNGQKIKINDGKVDTVENSDAATDGEAESDK